MSALAWSILLLSAFLSSLFLVHGIKDFFANGWNDLEKREEYKLEIIRSAGALIIVILAMIFI